MPRTYTKKEMAHLLSCSVPTIEKDADWLNLKPLKGDRNINLYTQVDLELIKQMRAHCADKSNSRESFLPQTVTEIVEVEPQITKIVRGKQQNFTNLSQIIQEGLSQDPLFDLEILQRISDNCWLLPAGRLAPLFGISAGYLNKLKIYYFCGFIANKETYAGGRALWKVSANNS
jgi:hypothetical protein